MPIGLLIGITLGIAMAAAIMLNTKPTRSERAHALYLFWTGLFGGIGTIIELLVR